MAKIIKANQPCLRKACGSSDGRQVYENGSYCFVCTKFFPLNYKEDDAEDDPSQYVSKGAPKLSIKPKEQFVKKLSKEEILELPKQAIKDRFISKETADFFGVRTSYTEQGVAEAHYYPYGEKGWQVRALPKKFYWHTAVEDPLFGRELFNGGGKRIVITEGVIDCLSVAEAHYSRYQRFYPVVAVPSATTLEGVFKNLSWIRSFQEIVLMLDDDEEGHTATEKILKALNYVKVKVAKLSEKDPNKMLMTHGPESIMTVIYEAESRTPSGIIAPNKLKEAMFAFNKKPSTPYPPEFEGLNEKLEGMRSGEISLIISGTGCGKSTLQREIIYHLLKTTEEKVGLLALEEDPGPIAQKMVGLHLSVNLAHNKVEDEILDKGFDEILETGRLLLLDHQGAINDNTVMDHLEYMALVGCKFIFIDHLTILVSEGTEDLKGNEAQDKVMNDLLKLVKRYPVHIGLVSHLRKSPSQNSKSFEQGIMPTLDDIKGSGSVKQISFDIIATSRNLTAEDPLEVCRTEIAVLKGRTKGLTGRVAPLYYNIKTGRLGKSEPFEAAEYYTIDND